MSELPKGWVASPLLDVVDLHDSRRIPLNATQRAQRRGEYPYYGANGQVDSIDDYIFDGEYVLLAEDGGYFDDSSRGVAYEVSGKFWVNNHAHILSARGGIPRRYLTHALNFLDWLPYVSGTTRLKLTQQGMQKVKIPLPPLPEQRRIVAKLDSLFERTRRAREELSHIPRLIENYKKAVLEAAFRGDLTKEWIRRGPATLPVSPRGSAAIKKKYRLTGDASFSPPYAIPDDWRWLRLPELGDLDRGKSKHRPRNDPALYGGDFPFFQTAEVRGADRYLRYFSKTYNARGLAQSRLWPAGTVCITIAANIAETAILDIDACFPDSVVGFVADENRVSNSYIEFFLRTMKDDLNAFAPATAQKNINLDTLSSLYVPVPPLLEQAEIVRRIEKAMDWLSVVDAEQRQATHLLDHLDEANLAKAFRGELVPQDSNDEPASVLLDRIRVQRAGEARSKRGRRGRSATSREAMA